MAIDSNHLLVKEKMTEFNQLLQEFTEKEKMTEFNESLHEFTVAHDTFDTT